MPNSPGGHRTANGRALSIAVHTFGGTYRDLLFADAVRRLREALDTIGFSVEILDDPTADQLGAAVVTFLKAPGDGARVIHIMTHGAVSKPTGTVHAIGADAQFSESTRAADWPDAVESYAEYGDQYTLFVLDFCFSGQAAWPAWSAQTPGYSRRSWVIAASEPDHVAYSALLTTALGDLIHRLSRQETATGLNLDPAEPYVPFGLLVEETRAAVGRLIGDDVSAHQRVVATPVDGIYPQLPFFANPLRISPDSLYWFGPSSGKRRQTSDEEDGTGFIGREKELTDLTVWLEQTQDPAAGPVDPLRVVTGRRGSGKTALLGMLVVAAHYEYSAVGDRLWQGSQAGDAPPRFPRGQFVAAHTRHHDLGAVLQRLVDQLRADDRLDRDLSGQELARVLCEVVAEYADPPVIVLDAVDESTDPTQLVRELILPLTRQRFDKRPLAYCLVGVRRDEAPFDLLAAAVGPGWILDLDDIDSMRLHDELTKFVKGVMRRNSDYARPGLRNQRDAFATGVATKLAHRPPDRRGGEFLVSGLYTHFVVSSEGPPFLGKDPGTCGDDVPVDPHRILEMDLAGAAQSRPLRRPVLAALAHAEGTGMPVPVVRMVATMWSVDGIPTAEQIEAVLDAEAMYVQSSLDVHGTMLYRLNEPAVEEHLRSHPCDERETVQGQSGVLDVVLKSMGDHDSVRRPWHRAEPYVTKHAAGHASRENRLTDLLDEPGYIIHADTDLLRPLLTGLCAAHGSAPLLRGITPATLRSLDYGERRHLLALEAVRWGQRALALEFLETPTRNALESRATPLWATASDLDSRQLTVFRGHTDEVNTVLLTQCGERTLAISAGLDRAIRFSDPFTGLEAATPLTGHVSEINALAISRRNGEALLYSASVDQTIRQWRLKAGREPQSPTLTVSALTGPEAVLRGHTGAVMAVAAFRMGSRHMIASGSADTTIRIWDAKSGRLHATWSGHTDIVTCLAVITRAGETLIASGSGDGSVCVWDASTGALRTRLLGHRDTVTCLTVFTHRRRTLIASGSADETVRLWDVEAESPIGGPREGHFGIVTAIALLPGARNRTLISADSTGALYEWAAELSPAQGTELRGHQDEITSIHATSELLLTGSVDTSVRAWGRRPITAWRPESSGHQEAVVGLTSMNVDGTPVCVSADTRTVRLWTLNEEKPALVHTVPLTTLNVATITAAGNDSVVVGTADGELCSLSIAHETISWEFYAHTRAIVHMAILEIGGSEQLVTVGAEGMVRRWRRDQNGFTLLGELLGDASGAQAATTCMIENDPVVVIAGYDRTLTVWTLVTDTLRGTLPSHGDEVTALACAEIDGIAHVFAAQRDRTIRFWVLHTLEQAGTFLGHEDSINAIACHTAGGITTVASVDNGNRVVLWDPATCREVERLVLPEAALCAHWSDQGRLVLGFGRDVAVFDSSDIHDAFEDID